MGVLEWLGTHFLGFFKLGAPGGYVVCCLGTGVLVRSRVFLEEASSPGVVEASYDVELWEILGVAVGDEHFAGFEKGGGELDEVLAWDLYGHTGRYGIYFLDCFHFIGEYDI